MTNIPRYILIKAVKSSSTHKHLRIEFDTKLDFSLNLKNVQNKVNKTIGLLRKLQDTAPRTSLITIFKSLISPHLDYGDIIYDREYITLRFIKSSNQFNTMLHQQLQAQKEELLEEISIKRWALSLFNKDAGIENFVAYSK